MNDIDIIAFCDGEGIKYSPDKIELPFKAFWRGDEKASGSLNQQTRLWYDHGTNEGGNLYQYIEKSRRLRPSEAKAYVRKHYIRMNPVQNPIKEKIHPDLWLPLKQVPEEVQNRTIGPEIHKMGRRPNAEYTYRDLDGKLIGIVARWDREDGEKIVLPFSFCKNRVTGRMDWRCKELPKPFPLFGAQFIKNWKGPVLIVEGEKCCVDANKKIGDVMLPLTWHGGANRVFDTDWSPLYKWPYGFTIWPDNDSAGMTAALQISEMIKNGKD